MEPLEAWVEEFGVALAVARRQGGLVDLRLDRLMMLEHAEVVQAAALEAYGGSCVGFSIQGTSVLSRRRLLSDEPIFAPLLDTDVVRDGTRFRLPNGVLGAGCSFAFAFGRPYPAEGEKIDRQSVSDAVADCRLAIEVLGRRVPGSIPLNALTATADFGLSVLHIEAPHPVSLPDFDISRTSVAAKINGKIVVTANGMDVMGDPLEAIVWLANELKKRGRGLEAGDLIATGTCVGILQVMPGQIFEGDFGPLGSLSVQFE